MKLSRTAIAVTAAAAAAVFSGGVVVPRSLADTAAYAEQSQLRWEQTEMAGNERAVSRFMGDVPDGTTFSIDEDLVTNLLKVADLYVDERKGHVTLSPEKPLAVNQVIEIPITVNYPDGGVNYADAVFSVTTPGKWMAEEVEIKYEDVEATAPGPFTSRPSGDWPDGTTFSVPDEESHDINTVVDPKTGEVTVTPPYGSAAGQSFSVSVIATLPDGSRRMETVKFTLLKPENPEADSATIVFPDVTIRAGQTVEVEPEGLPEGARLRFASYNSPRMGMRILEGRRVWMEATEGSKLGEHLMRLSVTFKDGSTTYVSLKISVESKSSTPAETPTSVEQPTTPENLTPSTPDPEPAPEPTPEPTLTPTPAPAPTDEGSSTGGIIAIVIGVLAAIGGLAFAAKPQQFSSWGTC